MTGEDVARFAAALAGGGVGLFPADTVYGLAADPDSRDAVSRLYEIKGRPPDRPAAVMFFALEPALGELPKLGPRTRAALGRLLPGGVTLLLPNPERRWPLACGPVPERLGLRVPALADALAPMAALPGPVLQSSANPSGGADARRLADVDPRIRSAVDAELDGGELPGTPSTVIDLTRFEEHGEHRIVREGAVAAEAVANALSSGRSQL